jgi:hypothetical protein
MQVMHVMKKGGKIYRYFGEISYIYIYIYMYIYNETKLGQQIKDKTTVTQNILFFTIVQKVSDRRHT